MILVLVARSAVAFSKFLLSCYFIVTAMLCHENFAARYVAYT